MNVKNVGTKETVETADSNGSEETMQTAETEHTDDTAGAMDENNDSENDGMLCNLLVTVTFCMISGNTFKLIKEKTARNVLGLMFALCD